MRKINYIWYVLLAVFIPIAITTLTLNIVLRLPETYVYHFNDSEIINELPTDLKGGDFADEITSYLNSPKKGEFQVYEKNGKFKDAIFDKRDSRAMKNAKSSLFKISMVSVTSIIVSIACYWYLKKKNMKKILRISGYIWTGITGIYIIILQILLRNKTIRIGIYNKLISVNLTKGSSLLLILGPPFYKTVLIFFTLTTILITAIIFYFNFKFAKEERLFS